MIRKITVIPDSFAEKIFFFQNIDLQELSDPRIVPLFGPNGIGKTTLEKSILSYCSEKASYDDLIKSGDVAPDNAEEYFQRGIKRYAGVILDMDDERTSIFSYQNSSDNFRIRKPSSYLEAYSPEFFANKLNAIGVSEGQSIIYSVNALLDGLAHNDLANDSNTTVIALLDEIDSGLSIDNIDFVMRKLKKALKQHENVQIFLGFNSPRVLKYFPYVVSLYDGHVKEMHTEDDMLAEIKKNKKNFDKARKKSNGTPKIFD